MPCSPVPLMVSSLLDIVHVPGRSSIRRALVAATAAIIAVTFGSSAVGVAALAAACGGGCGSSRAASCSCGRAGCGRAGGRGWAACEWSGWPAAAARRCVWSGGMLASAILALSGFAAAVRGVRSAWRTCEYRNRPVFSLLLSLADVEVFRVVHVISDSMMYQRVSIGHRDPKACYSQQELARTRSVQARE